MAKSIPVQSSLFGPLTCEGSPNAISSPASADGATPCGSPDGPTIGPSGRAPAPVSPSRRPAPKLAGTIRATFGRPGFSSSKSAALSSSLVSRLKARLPTGGSTVFAMTWKQKTTPSGRVVSLLRASARSTSDSDSGSWATPMSRDYRSVTGRETEQRDNAMQNLNVQSTLAAWPLGVSLTSLSLQASGAMPSGSPAETAKQGQLNPAHSRWLMGYPPEFCACAVTAMPSFRTSLRSSSRRTATVEPKG